MQEAHHTNHVQTPYLAIIATIFWRTYCNHLSYRHPLYLDITRGMVLARNFTL